MKPKPEDIVDQIDQTEAPQTIDLDRFSKLTYLKRKKTRERVLTEIVGTDYATIELIRVYKELRTIGGWSDQDNSAAAKKLRLWVWEQLQLRRFTKEQILEIVLDHANVRTGLATLALDKLAPPTGARAFSWWYILYESIASDTSNNHLKVYRTLYQHIVNQLLESMNDSSLNDLDCLERVADDLDDYTTQTISTTATAAQLRKKLYSGYRAIAHGVKK